MASIDTSWMPVKGRHQVRVGTSLGRALKARRLQGDPPPNTKRAIPNNDFHSLRYNFKPGTIDPNKPGTIEASGSSLTVQHPITKAGEAALFTGVEQPAKDVECVLIYDEETGTFTLEKLDSFIILKHERKTVQLPRISPPAPSPAPTVPRRNAEYDDIDRDLLELAEEEDAEGEIDDTLDEIVPTASTSRRQEEEEEDEGEIFEAPTPPPPKPKSPPPPPRPAPKAARATKPLPKARAQAKQQPVSPPPPPPVVAPAPAPAPVVAPQPKPKPAPKRKQSKKEQEPIPVVTHPDEEVLTFGSSAVAAPAHSTYTNPPPPPPASSSSGGGLALPGGSSGFAPLPPAKTPSRPAPIPVEDSDEDEEWDEVEPAPAQDEDIFGDDPDGGDMGMDDLEAELMQELGEEEGEGEEDEEEDDEEDFLMGMMEETETPKLTGQPISLNQLAGGMVASDDDYSSSDDSDDD